MKNWKQIAAGFLAALMLTGCGSVDETINTVNAVVGVVDELTADAVTTEGARESDTVDGASDDAQGDVSDDAASGDTGDAAAEEAVATRPDDDIGTIDPAFTVGADTEGIDDDFVVGNDGDIVEIEPSDEGAATEDGTAVLDEDGYYYDKDSVALYLVTYHKLPSNYITKKQAQALGWSGGALDPYAPDMAIGGDHFGNYEGLLPDDDDYNECDIDTHGKKRGAKRIIYSDDWDIYYTEDHYESFEQLY